MPSRGRPTKFGRPSRAVVLTLPLDVIDWLERKNPDLARAVVELHAASHPQESGPAEPSPCAELVQLPRRRALIVVDPRLVTDLAGVAPIPLADGRAFLALDPGKSLADLELAVVDRLDAASPADAGYADLAAFRALLRDWRTRDDLRFHIRSILVAERSPAGRPVGPLSALERAQGEALGETGQAAPR